MPQVAMPKPTTHAVPNRHASLRCLTPEYLCTAQPLCMRRLRDFKHELRDFKHELRDFKGELRDLKLRVSCALVCM